MPRRFLIRKFYAVRAFYFCIKKMCSTKIRWGCYVNVVCEVLLPNQAFEVALPAPFPPLLVLSPSGGLEEIMVLVGGVLSNV